MNLTCWTSTSSEENSVSERHGVSTRAEHGVPLGPPRVQAAAAHQGSRDSASHSSAAYVCENDESVLVAALEEIETRRAALEWLLEGNLLCLLLV